MFAERKYCEVFAYESETFHTQLYFTKMVVQKKYRDSIQDTNMTWHKELNTVTADYTRLQPRDIIYFQTRYNLLRIFFFLCRSNHTLLTS